MEDAYKHVKIPKALEVLETQKWDYERKLNQIHMRKLHYDKLKSKEIVPSTQTEVTSSNIKKDTVNAQSIARSIDKTIKEFNDKYGRTLMDNKQRDLSAKDNCDSDNEPKETRLNDITKENHIEQLETQTRHLSLIEEQTQTTDEDLPSLAPLELPSFDYTVFGD